MKMKKRQNACEYSTTRQRQQEETAAAAASNNMVILPSEARRGSTTSAVTSDCQISNRRNLRRNSVHQTEDISAEHQIIISSTTTTTTNQHQQQQQQPLAALIPWPRRLPSLNTTSLLVVLLCILLSLCSPCNSTPLFAPTMHTSHRSAKPKWVNPCGIDPNQMRRLSHAFGGHYAVQPLSDAELLQNVILAAKNALRHSKVFKESYVKKTFHTSSWWDHHETWKDMRYDWLPSWDEVPKHLHEKAGREHLESLQVDSALVQMFTSLQKLAVGLEQVVLDQMLYDGNFLEEFNEAEFKLKAVLCELQVAMLEKGIVHNEATSRKIMSQDIRDIEDSSYRNLRDWYIYRDYMNGLEFVVHAFDHLRRKKMDPPQYNNYNQRRRRRH